MQPSVFLKDCFESLVGFASASVALSGNMPTPPQGRTFVLAVGKAGASMARAFEDNWPSDQSLSGIALTRYEHGEPCDRIQVIEAGHPVPDGVGTETARQVIDQLKHLAADDLFVCLISGGGSALLSLPAPGISVEEKRDLNRQLLASGLDISNMNCLRKHVSAVKGGRLAQTAFPARVHTIAISDVPGNDLSTIASGPTVPDTTTSEQALSIAKSLPNPPSSVIEWLSSISAETPKGGPEFDASYAKVSITPESAFDALIEKLASKDIDVHYLGADIEGEASDLGRSQAQQALDMQNGGLSRPALILSGGETTVTFDGGKACGKGGRNCEYLLALFDQLKGTSGIYALAADTDGIDGSEDNAGAWFGPADWTTAADLGLDTSEYLSAHNSYGLFEKLGLLLKPGPTRTNINDFRAIWIEPAEV